jgi:hypothetical protein
VAFEAVARAHDNIFEQLINTVKMNSLGQILAAL